MKVEVGAPGELMVLKMASSMLGVGWEASCLSEEVASASLAHAFRVWSLSLKGWAGDCSSRMPLPQVAVAVAGRLLKVGEVGLHPAVWELHRSVREASAVYC